MAPPVFRITTIESPIELIDDPDAHRWFQATARLRLSGYRKEQGLGYLPFDAYDYLATHVIVSEVRGDEQIPVMSFRFISDQQCREHRLEFPGSAIARSSQATDHERVLTSILERCRARKIGVAYVGSWTIAPETRTDRGLVKLLKELVIGLHPLYHREYGISESLLCGSLRHRTPELQKRIGYLPFSEAGRELGSFRQYSMNDEDVIMLHLSGFTDEAEALARRFRFLWESRERILPGKAPAERKIAAAA